MAVPIADPRAPVLLYRGRVRRVFADNGGLRANRGRVAHKHPLTEPSPRERAVKRLRSRLAARAAGPELQTLPDTPDPKLGVLGLPLLPGPGTITLATRYLPQGRAFVLSCIRFAAEHGDPDARTFQHVLLDLPRAEREAVTVDELCAAAGISPVALLKAIIGVAFEHGVDVAKLVAVASLPEVVAATVRYAQDPDGHDDRKLLLQQHGLAPTPKGSTINLGVAVHASAQAAATASTDDSVPPFLTDAEEVAETVHTMQGLIEGEVAPPSPWADANSEGTLKPTEDED